VRLFAYQSSSAEHLRGDASLRRAGRGRNHRAAFENGARIRVSSSSARRDRVRSICHRAINIDLMNGVGRNPVSPLAMLFPSFFSLLFSADLMTAGSEY